jgi:hypothetical protein
VAPGYVVHTKGRWQYIARMEDVLDLYAESPDSKRPVVRFDESPVQLIGEVRQPIPAKPGQFERCDYEYRRNGTVNLFVVLVLRGQCLSRSINNQKLLRREIAIGNKSEIKHALVSNGCSQPTNPAPKWGAPIPTRPKRHNHCEAVLDTRNLAHSVGHKLVFCASDHHILKPGDQVAPRIFDCGKAGYESDNGSELCLAVDDEPAADR